MPSQDGYCSTSSIRWLSGSPSLRMVLWCQYPVMVPKTWFKQLCPDLNGPDLQHLIFQQCHRWDGSVLTPLHWFHQHQSNQLIYPQLTMTSSKSQESTNDENYIPKEYQPGIEVPPMSKPSSSECIDHLCEVTENLAEWWDEKWLSSFSPVQLK